MNESNSVGLVVPRQYSRPGERLKVIECWNASGLSAERFSAQSGITVRTLCRWRREVLGAPRERSLVELPALTSDSWIAEVTSKAGSVRLSASASPAWAATLIRELNRC